MRNVRTLGATLLALLAGCRSRQLSLLDEQRQAQIDCFVQEDMPMTPDGLCASVCVSNENKLTHRMDSTCSRSFTDCEGWRERWLSNIELENITTCTRVVVAQKSFLVRKIEDLRSRACKCTDITCAEKVQQDFMRLIVEAANVKGTKRDQELVNIAADQLMGASRTSTAGSRREGTHRPDTRADT